MKSFSKRLIGIWKILDKVNMNPKQWVVENGPCTPTEAQGKCQEYVERMKEAFPNLTVRAGFYYDAVWGARQHWWLETDSGEIVDPTAIQFPGGAGADPSHYEFVPEEDRPIGVCANCGELCYQGSPSDMLCSSRCERSYIAYLNGGVL